MDALKQIESFVGAATRGSLSAAARAEGVTPAIIGRRLDALELRLGVKLLTRTTRTLSLTFEGAAFLEDCQRILTDLANAEASVSLGGVKASGHLRVSAPAGFGRLHVAPLVNGKLIFVAKEGDDLPIGALVAKIDTSFVFDTPALQVLQLLWKLQLRP